MRRGFAGGGPRGGADRVWARTALLDYLAAAALGCRIERAPGVNSEMELAFAGLHQLLAGLHQLCAPMLDRLETVPVPQREALRPAFGGTATETWDNLTIEMPKRWSSAASALTF